MDLGLQNQLIERSGAWFSYGDVRLGQGRENVKNFLKENRDLSSEIEQKLRTLLGLSKPVAKEAEQTAAPAETRPTASAAAPPARRPQPGRPASDAGRARPKSVAP